MIVYILFNFLIIIFIFIYVVFLDLGCFDFVMLDFFGFVNLDQD